MARVLLLAAVTFGVAVAAPRVARSLVVQDRPPMLMDYCCSVIVPGALLRTDRSKAAALTRALMRGSAWTAAHPAEAARMEVEGKHVPASLAVNETALGMLAFVPSVGAAQANTRDVLGRIVKLGFLDPATDVPALLNQMVVPVTGELAVEDVTVLQLAALRGVFTHVVEDQVTFVNVPSLAADRGVGVELTTAPESENHRSVVQLRAAMPDGESITVSGTLTGRSQVQKLVEVNGRHFDLRAEGEVIVLEYADRPGVMGRVGSLLGEAAVNIEAAQISQTTDGADAIMLLRVDRPVDPGVLEPIGASIGARTTRLVSFD